LDEEVVEAPGGVGGSDGIVSSGKKKVLKRVRIKKKIKKMEVGEQTVSIFTSLVLFVSANSTTGNI
jgi:hypothetical protein